jgi:hypothetical protein
MFFACYIAERRKQAEVKVLNVLKHDPESTCSHSLPGKSGQSNQNSRHSNQK